MINRRQLITAVGATTLLSGARAENPIPAEQDELRAASKSPVLRRDRLTDPVIIESVELLRNGKQFFVHVRSRDGATGIALTNQRLIRNVYPLFLQMVAPYFVGKDARDLDALVDGVFRNALNYKWQGLAFWVCVAWLEFAVLDLLGKQVERPIGELLGGRLRNRSAIYYANGDRKSSAEEVVDKLRALIDKSGARAVKFKLGARMHYTEASTRRDLELIPLARKALGDDATLYTDSNSSFDVPMAIRIGKLLEEHNYAFFEEPVQFDYLEETKAVADALDIPIAGGEQETSMRRMRWLIENRAVQIPQPDLLFFGGLIRSIRAARMADQAGMKVVPHMSGFGLGILYVLHFASVTPNANEFQEYKGDKDGVPYEVVGTGKPLESIDGEIEIPAGPGLGVKFDPDYLAAAERVHV